MCIVHVLYTLVALILPQDPNTYTLIRVEKSQLEEQKQARIIDKEKANLSVSTCVCSHSIVYTQHIL